MTFEWNLLENTLPNTWSYSLCDLGHCFFVIPNRSTLEMLTKEQQDDGLHAFFKITIQTGEANYRYGVVRIYVYDKANLEELGTSLAGYDHHPIIQENTILMQHVA